ncbi:MAG: phosphohistidine phosphatase [Nitrososphaeraceae archaeon]|nr:phosphohistidine phosphatase [Nitrososphaeraceae archaeon]
MRKLLLLRHGKSSWDDHNLEDHDRPLTERGREDSFVMGKFLKKENLIPDLIISSTAKRANKTANIIAKNSGYDGEILETKTLYTASSGDYEKIIKDIHDEYKTILLVGHNPVIEEVVERITGIMQIMKTCSLVQINLHIDSWKNFHFDRKYELASLFNVKEIKKMGGT